MVSSSHRHSSSRRPRRLLAAALLMPCLVAAAPVTAHADLRLPPVRVTAPGVLNLGKVDLAPGANGSTHIMYGKAGVGTTTRRLAADGTLGPERVVAPTTHPERFAVESSEAVQVVWRESDGSNLIVRTRRMAADGTLGPIADLSSAGFSAYRSDVRVDGAGQATFLWYRTLASGAIVQARRRFADGTFSKVQNISVVAKYLDDPVMDIDAAGNVHVVWADEPTGGEWTVRTRRWNADGTLGPIRDVSAPGTDGQDAAVAVDGAGSAHLFWEGNGSGRTRRIDHAGVMGPIAALGSGTDAADELVAVRHPAGGVQAIWRGALGVETARIGATGEPGPISVLGKAEPGADGQVTPAVAVDAVGKVTGTWREKVLGSSGIAVRARAVHPDGGLGAVQPLFTPITDHETVESAPDVVAGPTGPTVAGWAVLNGDSRVEAAVGETPAPSTVAPGGPGTPTQVRAPVITSETVEPPTPPIVDRALPRLTGLALAERRVRVAGRVKLSFTLSEPARVTLIARRIRGGRIVGGACRTRTRANAGRKACDLDVPGAMRLSGRAGSTTVRLTARFGGRALRPGSYALVGRATTADGRVSAPAQAGLKVVARRR